MGDSQARLPRRPGRFARHCRIDGAAPVFSPVFMAIIENADSVSFFAQREGFPLDSRRGMEYNAQL